MPMNPLLMSSMFNAGESVIQGGLNQIFAKSNMRAQNKIYQENWEKNNAYNHPTAQMNRLKEAGLNPNLVYGNGSATNTSTAAPAAPQNKQAPEIKGGLSDYVMLRNAQVQNDLIEKQKEFIDMQIRDKESQMNYRDNVQTNKTVADTDYTELSAEYKKQVINAFDTNTGLDQGLKRAQIAHSSSSNELLLKQIDSYPIELRNRILETKSRIQNLNASTNNLSAQSKKIQMETEMIRLAKNMREAGVEVNDHLLARMFSDVLKVPKNFISDIIDKIFN